MTTGDAHGDPIETDVVVIGAGLAGLTAAATAAREPGVRVVVLDSHRAGGRARVDERNGYRFNRGPHALYRSGPGRPILEALGVDVTSGGQPATKGAMGRLGGELHLLPQGVVSGVRSRLIGARDMVQLGALMARLPRLDPGTAVGLTLDDWIAANRFRPAVSDMVRMLARVATYTNAPDLVDAGAVLGNVRSAFTGGVQYLDGGFQSLVDGLVDRLAERDVDVRTGPAAAVTAIEETFGGVTVLAGGATVHARSAVVAAGGPEAVARMLGSAPAPWAGLGPSPTAACLELGPRRPPPHRVVFGVDEPTYLSTHCPPADLAPPGHAVVHVMRYQPVDDDLSADEQHAVLQAVASSAGITSDDIVEERFLARMVVTGPMPLAADGGLAGRVGVELADRPGVLLAGDWIGPQGLLSDAAVASGAEAGRLAASRATRMALT